VEGRFSVVLPIRNEIGMSAEIKAETHHLSYTPTKKSKHVNRFIFHHPPLILL